MPPKPHPTHSDCPLRPELRAPQRAKVLLILSEPDSERGQMWVDGWAQIDGPWLLLADDEHNLWQSWPIQHIRCVEWLHPLLLDETVSGEERKP